MKTQRRADLDLTQISTYLEYATMPEDPKYTWELVLSQSDY